MKTFDEKDLITWSNRDKAKIGEEYYFCSSLDAIKINIEKGDIGKLKRIRDSSIDGTFEDKSLCLFPCILPVDAVKEIKPEKKYRPCKTIKELHGLVNGWKCDIGEEVCIDELIGDCIVHYRSKKTGREFYSVITCVTKHEEGYLVYLGVAYFLSELFDNFEIEVNGKWKPFGVLKK